MRRTQPYFATVVVPVIHGQPYVDAVRLAEMVAVRSVRLVGMVAVPRDASMSGAATTARTVRDTLRRLAGGKISSRANVIVSQTPWEDLLDAIREEDPDLLLLDARNPAEALGVETARVLRDAPCDVAVVRGPIPDRPAKALVPIRGGPHAELSVRLALRLANSVGTGVTTVHFTPPGAESETDAPFRGLRQVVTRLPEVTALERVTADPVGEILKDADSFDLMVIGTAGQPHDSPNLLGPVADRMLRDSRSAVVAVRSRREMPSEPAERVGQKAISILVDRWFAENTFAADEFSDLERLVALKREQRVKVSLALPSLNEEETVGNVLTTLKEALVERAPLLDEIVLVDSNSTDRTREIARSLGIPVFIHQEILPQYGVRAGKGEALWKSLYVTRGDIVVWVDTDIVNMHPRFVYGIVGPLLQNPEMQFVKGYYRRPLRVDGVMKAGEGGRVTELTVRPLFNLYFPELSGFVQPLSGEYGGRRSALEQMTFCSGYGVESGLLIDIFEKFGLFAIAQVDLRERIHHNQPLEALSKMSFAIMQTIMSRVERRAGTELLGDVNRTMKLIRYEAGELFLDVEEIVERERTPMLNLPEYRRAFGK